MTKLADLQRKFQQYLENDRADITQHIVTTDKALAKHRLAAYYNAYRARLIEALAFDFPALQAFLGDEKFAYLVIAYIKTHPSNNTSVRWVGKKLATYIKQQPPFEHQNFLTELALFEWQQSLVFDGQTPKKIVQPKDMTFTPEQWPNLHFQFIPNIHTIQLHYNVHQFWQAVEDKIKLPDIIKQKQTTQWLFWRKNLDPNWRSLETHEAWALAQAQAGHNFATICEGLNKWFDDDQIALIAAGLLKQWINDQLLTHIHTH